MEKVPLMQMECFIAARESTSHTRLVCVLGIASVAAGIRQGLSGHADARGGATYCPREIDIQRDAVGKTGGVGEAV